MPDESAAPAASPRRVRIPRSLADIGTLIDEIGAFLAERDPGLGKIAEKRARLRQRMKKLDDDEEKLKRRYERRLNPRADKVFTYAQERYDELTDDGESRTVSLRNGAQFRWRNSGRKVLWIDAPEAFIREVRQKRLFTLFVRVKIIFEPNLEALTAHPDKAALLKTVRLGSEDTFSILPNGTDARYQTVVEKDGDRKWSVEVPKKRKPKE